VFLYDIDDLEGIVESNLEHRRQEAAKIEAMISEEIDLFEQWYKTLGVVPLIRALQTKAASIHEETMNSLTNKLPDLDEHELKVIRKLTKSIVNQMMQDPIIRIKEMAGEKRSDEAMDMFVKLFALENELAKTRQAELETATDTVAAAKKKNVQPHAAAAVLAPITR
jgi:glutamyl-tRNA reductase